LSIEHRAFPKIARTAPGATGGEWVATEKIHGAHVVVGTDGTEVAIGKRRAWLRPGDAFFGWQVIRPLLEKGARSMHARLATRSTLWLYGELFGGGYPHPDVASIPGFVPVQTGVWYGPDLYFAAFDAVTMVAGHDAYLWGWDELVSLAAEAGLETVPLLGRGSRAEIESVPVRFETRIPARHGLPPIADNYAEGYVLKTAARSRADERSSLKRKIPEFDEDRFGDSCPFDPDRHLSFGELKQLARAMVNDPRIASARSKAGTGRNAVIEEVVLDVMIDLGWMFPRRLKWLASDEEADLSMSIAARADELLSGDG
jgi:Rnl2 family RNA ligase